MARRRMKKAFVNFISLVPKGANQIATIYKSESDNPTFDFQTIVKSFDSDKGELTTVVYAPEFRDSQGDIAGADVIKDAMYEAAKNGFDIDIRHDEKPVGKTRAFVAESFVIQKADPRFTGLKDYKGNVVDPTGGWGLVVKIEDPDLRAKYKSGEWQGVSMGGKALMEIEKENPGDKSMTLEEITKAMTENNKSLVTSLSESLGKLFTDAGLIKKEAPVAEKPKARPFTGPFTPEGIKKHALTVQKAAITESIDFTNPASVAEAAENIAKIDSELAEISKAPADAVASQIKTLEDQISKLRKASNQGTGAGTQKTKGEESTSRIVGLEKSDEEDFEAQLAVGSGMAKFINGGR